MFVKQLLLVEPQTWTTHSGERATVQYVVCRDTTFVQTKKQINQLINQMNLNKKQIEHENNIRTCPT